MANDLTSNPLRCDTTATIIAESEGVDVLAMQWVDDDSAAGGVIADDEDLIMIINGVTVEINIQVGASIQPVPWSIQFSQPFKIFSMFATMVGGTLFVWKG